MQLALFLIKNRGPGWVAGFALPEHTWSYSSLEVCTVHAVWEGRHTLTWVFTLELHQDKHLHKWKVRRKCYKALPTQEDRTVLHRCKVEWLVEFCSLGFKVQVFKKTYKSISMHKAWMCRLTSTQLYFNTRSALVIVRYAQSKPCLFMHPEKGKNFWEARHPKDGWSALSKKQSYLWWFKLGTSTLKYFYIYFLKTFLNFLFCMSNQLLPGTRALTLSEC